MSWGATDEERRAQLPGDELQTHPLSLSTRAITIDAPPSAVWPWLVQMGHKRAGFYSYDWIERLMGGGDYVEGHSATHLHPELQNLKVGDKIYLGSFTSIPVTMMEPNHYLVLGTMWITVLKELDGQQTRLIIRMKNPGFFKHSAPVLGGILYVVDSVLNWLGYDPGLDFFMVRKLMLGIKERAEQTWREQTPPHGPGETIAAASGRGRWAIRAKTGNAPAPE